MFGRMGAGEFGRMGRPKGMVGAGVSYSAEALAIFAAFTTPPSTARKALIDACVVSLKTAGVWSKLDALYMFAAADSQAALINWKNPGTYNATAVNSPTFTADHGFTGASTKYIDSNFNASTAVGSLYTRNSACLFGWSLTAAQSDGGLVGLSGAQAQNIYPRYTDNSCFIDVNDVSSVTVAVATGAGMTLGSRTASNAVSGYRDGSSIGSSANASAALKNFDMLFLQDQSTYYTGVIACGGCGAGLVAGEVLAHYNALHTYLQTVAGVA